MRPRRPFRSACEKELRMSRLSRKILPLLAAALILTTSALAQSPTISALHPSHLVMPSSPDLFARLWSFLIQTWSKNGCEMDPSGRCLHQDSTSVSGDNGCSVDPDGRCKTGQSAYRNGCEVDPNGRCIQ